MSRMEIKHLRKGSTPALDPRRILILDFSDSVDVRTAADG